MSGVAGGNRIQKADVQRTFDKYVKQILEKVPGFKKASLSGSVKVGTKPDYGDLDLVTWFEGDDKKEVKKRLIKVATSQPDSIIVPFKSEKYTGRKYYNSGEIITVLFPIQGKTDEYIQVDNIIALSEEEHGFKNSFLDLPAEKQGLILGLAKVITLEENPKSIFKRLSITDVPELQPDEEFEFNLSSGKLSLRKVKLDNFKEVGRQEIWSTTNWGLIKQLFINYKIDGTFEELLHDLQANLKNTRSRRRIKGIFNSMVSIKSGEVGTPKGAGKQKALDAVNALLEAKNKIKRIKRIKTHTNKPLTSTLLEHIEEIKLTQNNAVDTEGNATKGQFTVGKVTYEYEVENKGDFYGDGKDLWNVVFDIKGQEQTGRPKGGKENFIKVLSTMYSIILKFIQVKEPDYIGIASLDGEISYNTLYSYLTNPKVNKIPGYMRKSVEEPVITVDGEMGRTIVLKKINTTGKIDEQEQAKTVALYAGGFKPPHKAHFNNAQVLAGKADELVIFIGPKIREGIRISPEQSKAIWEVYSKYINVPVTLITSEITPVRDIYDFVDQNYDSYSKIITGALPEEMKKFAYFAKNREKYPKVQVVELPRIGDEDSKFSATSIRTSVNFLKTGEWIPSKIKDTDKKAIVNIAMKNTPTETEILMQEALDKTLEELFQSKNKKKNKTTDKNEGSSGTAIGPQSVVKSEDRAKLVHVYNRLINVLGDDYYDISFNQDHIIVKNKGENPHSNFDYTPYMGSILEYMIDQGHKITPLPEIKIRKDIAESSNFFGRTAFYNPTDREVVLYVQGRHPKDVMRSFVHEMIHHKQNLEGRLGQINTTNTNEDNSLMEIEKEAYLDGNMIFRNWEDSVKNN